MKARKLITGIIGFILTIGSVAFTNITTKTVTESVSAEAANATFDTNTSASARYLRKADNPHSWSSHPDTTGYTGTFYLNEMSSVKTQYELTTGSTMRLYEVEATKLLTAYYQPIRMILPSQKGYSKATVSATFTMTLEGGASENFATMRLYSFGDSTKDANKTKMPTTVAVPMYPSNNIIVNSPEEIKVIGNNNRTTPTTDTVSVSNYVSLNTSGDKDSTVCYLGVFIGARKDSTKSHQISAYLSATITYTYQLYTVRVGANALFFTLNEAASSITNSAYVYLVNDSTLTADISFSKEFTLLMNGNTLNCGGFQIAVASGGKVMIENNGKITGNLPNRSLFVNDGELRLTDVTIENTATNYSTSIGILNRGILRTSASITSGGYAIVNRNNGLLCFSGSATSHNNFAISVESGELRLTSSNATALNSTYQDIYFDQYNATFSCKNSDSGSRLSSGKKVSVKLNNNYTINYDTPIITDAPSLSIFDIVYPLNSIDCFVFDYPSKSIIKTRKIKNITFSVSNCSSDAPTSVDITQSSKTIYIYLTPDDNYSLPTDITIKMNGVAIPDSNRNVYYAYTRTYSRLDLKLDYLTGNIEICGACLILDTDLEAARYFKNYSMHMPSDNEGQCIEYYPTAKTNFNKLTYAARYKFLNDAEFAEAAARLRAWASYFGDTITNCTIQANTAINNISSSNNYLIITIISIAALLSFAAFVIIRKKKHEN